MLRETVSSDAIMQGNRQMLRPKEAAAEIEQLERKIMDIDFIVWSLPWSPIKERLMQYLHRDADRIRERIVELKQQYPTV